MSNGFNKPSSTRVDIQLPQHTEQDYGSISRYKPNLIDRFGDMFPDTGPTGVAKGIYRGMDTGLLGMLPSGRYQAETGETKTGKAIGMIADPFVVGRTAKAAVSGVTIAGKTYGTPLGRLIANNIAPQGYTNKAKYLKRPFKSWKVFKESVIDDIPQYKFPHPAEERLFAWRQKFGLGKPGPGYEKSLQLQQKLGSKGIYGANTRRNPIEDVPVTRENIIDDIWGRFGKHTEDGKEYFHYKNARDYKKGGGGWRQHDLFGKYDKWDFDTPKFRRHGYHDDWNFLPNKPLNKYRKTWNQKKILLQRIIGDYLTRDVRFKGAFKTRRRKKLYRQDADDMPRSQTNWVSGFGGPPKGSTQAEKDVYNYFANLGKVKKP
tara:strand:+ start:2270 stop:3394 length:1125 start_codon:yes stop_codon:yes gene_type:complete